MYIQHIHTHAYTQTHTYHDIQTTARAQTERCDATSGTRVSVALTRPHEKENMRSCTRACAISNGKQLRAPECRVSVFRVFVCCGCDVSHPATVSLCGRARPTRWTVKRRRQLSTYIHTRYISRLISRFFAQLIAHRCQHINGRVGQPKGLLRLHEWSVFEIKSILWRNDCQIAHIYHGHTCL